MPVFAKKWPKNDLKRTTNDLDMSQTWSFIFSFCSGIQNTYLCEVCSQMTTPWQPMTPTFYFKILSNYQNENVYKKTIPKKIYIFDEWRAILCDQHFFGLSLKFLLKYKCSLNVGNFHPNICIWSLIIPINKL